MPTKVIYQCARCNKYYKTKKESDKCCMDFLDFDICDLKINDMTLNYSVYLPDIFINGSISLRIKKLKTEVEIPVYCYEKLWFSVGIDDNLCNVEFLRTIPELNCLADQELEDIDEFIQENGIDESKIIEAMKNIKIKFILGDSSINLVYDKNKKETE